MAGRGASKTSRTSSWICRSALPARTLAAPQCTEAQLVSEAGCPAETRSSGISRPNRTKLEATINSPIWNLVPEHGHPAEFGYIDVLKGAHVAGYVSVVPSPAGYVLQIRRARISPKSTCSRIVVTFYGDPALAATRTRRACSAGRSRSSRTRRRARAARRSRRSGSTRGSTRRVPRTRTAIPANLKANRSGRKTTRISPPVTGCNALSFTPADRLRSRRRTKRTSRRAWNSNSSLPQTEMFGTNATPALKDLTIDVPAGDDGRSLLRGRLGCLLGCADRLARRQPGEPTLVSTSREGRRRNVRNRRRSARWNWKRR